MKFVEKMFNKGSGSSCKIGDINREKDHTEVLLGIVDSTFKDHGDGDVKPIFSLSDADIVETDNSWHLNSFDGFDSWVSISKWIDFTDLDGDPHHAKLTRCWDPDNPTDIHYYLEVDLLSES